MHIGFCVKLIYLQPLLLTKPFFTPVVDKATPLCVFCVCACVPRISCCGLGPRSKLSVPDSKIASLLLYQRLDMIHKTAAAATTTTTTTTIENGDCCFLELSSSKSWIDALRKKKNAVAAVLACISCISIETAFSSLIDCKNKRLKDYKEDYKELQVSRYDSKHPNGKSLIKQDTRMVGLC